MKNKTIALAAASVAVIGGLAIALVKLFMWIQMPWPPPAFEVPYRGYAVIDMHFSPDGGSIAVVTMETQKAAEMTHSVRIYQLPNGQMVHEINSCAEKCAWNREGSALAVARLKGLDFDIWDTRTWTPTRHLTIPLDNYEKSCLVALPVKRLSFDRDGSLYAAESSNTDGVNVPRLLGAKVWWDAGETQAEADSVGTWTDTKPPHRFVDMLFDLSVASMDAETRLALSYERTAAVSRTEILRIRRGPNGERTIRREFQLSALFDAWVHLTSDGKYLAARDAKGFHLFALFADHADLIFSRDDHMGMLYASFFPWQALDLSSDGRFVAYTGDRGAVVLHIPGGQTALEVRQLGTVALSPNGQLLAVANTKRKEIWFYQIPQNQSQEYEKR